MAVSYYIYRVLVVSFLAVVQVYFHRAALRLPAGSGRGRPAVHLLFGLFTLPLALFLYPGLFLAGIPLWLVTAWLTPLYLWHFSFAALFCALMAWKSIRLAGAFVRRVSRRREHPGGGRNAPAPAPVDFRRRRFVQTGAAALAGAALTASAYGSYHRDDLETTYVEIPVDRLPEGLEGFTIGLVSDIHSSAFMTKEEMARTAAAVNALGVDLIAVTGDFVDSRVDEVWPFAEAFGALRAPAGVFGVLGNHDYYTGDVEAVAREVNRCGITLLRNAAVPVTKNGAALRLVGVDDVGNRNRAERSFDEALAGGGRGEAPVVLLCHRPYYFRQAARRGIDLTLSGHTHGGQIVLTTLGRDVIAPARIASPYVAGAYALGSSRLYVSRGIGTVGVPIRINCPPEITKITLVAGARG